MQKLLKELSEIYIRLNKNFDEKLINHAELVDINEDIIDIFPKDCARLEQGIERMKKLNLSDLSSPNDEDYLKGMVDIYIALTDIENHFSNFRDAHIKISKKFRYISGEITLEEYLDDGIIELEEVDDSIDESDSV